MSSTAETALCRVCANPFESSTMIRLFDKANGPLALAEIFLQVSAVSVGDSRLPKCCCLRCKNRLKEVEDLRALCQESDRKLRKMIGDDRNEEESVDILPKVEVFEYSESYSCWSDPEHRFSSSDDEQASDFVEQKMAKRRSNRKVKTECKSDVTNQIDPEKEVPVSHKKSENDPDYVEPISKKSKKAKSESQFNKTPNPTGEPKGKRKRVYQCSLCGQIFASGYNLKEHESVHNPERLIKCPLCPKEFNRRNNYKRHMVVHKEQFKCTECDRSFRNGSTLEEHISTKHRGERPHQCKQCPKTYLTSASLFTHVQAIHKQNFRFKCDICFKSFLTKTILERHTLKHQGVKFSHCPHCDNKYESNNYLKQHIAERHPEQIENLARCEYCGLGYATDCHYRKHVVKKHPERLVQFDEWLTAKRESVKNGQQINAKVE
ncbi:zinc finger protein 286A-like [Culex quinquefasciatus]|uniref:zinc finger protein 286A-like n=1 Tax=Culex quinquefasciatus TaxID=7176 RepID=UPI0018E3C114|nr:zinc finger protein 286A-like [Culex quinquefasciatus]